MGNFGLVEELLKNEREKYHLELEKLGDTISFQEFSKNILNSESYVWRLVNIFSKDRNFVERKTSPSFSFRLDSFNFYLSPEIFSISYEDFTLRQFEENFVRDFYKAFFEKIYFEVDKHLANLPF